MTSAQTPNFSHTTFETREIVKLSKFCVSVKWHCAANKVLIIGRISRVSRQVASKQVILRAIERYGVSLHFRRNRLKQPKFRWKTTFWCKKRLDLGLEAAEKNEYCIPSTGLIAATTILQNNDVSWLRWPFLPEKNTITFFLHTWVF